MKICIDCGAEKSKKGNYCKKCGYKHRVRPSGLKYTKHKENPTSFKKGHIPWSTGKNLKKIDEYSKENSSLHKWLRRNFGIPEKCEFCGKTINIQWANKSDKYLRIRSDWIKLCVKCHQRYDYLNFGKRKKFYE